MKGLPFTDTAKVHINPPNCTEIYSKLIFSCFAVCNNLFNLASLLNTPSPVNESLDKFIIPNIFELSEDNALFQLDNF